MSVGISDNVEVRLPQQLAKFLKIKQRITASNVNNSVWILCGGLVGDSLIGSRALPLLTPTPLLINTTTLVSKEYVRVTQKTFDEITLKLVTNLSTMELFDSPYEVLIVLHFLPYYKRTSPSAAGLCKRSKLDDGYSD